MTAPDDLEWADKEIEKCEDEIASLRQQLAAAEQSKREASEEGARLAIAAAAKACRDHGDDWKRGVGNWTASEFLARADTAYDCALAVGVISIESILKGGK